MTDILKSIVSESQKDPDIQGHLSDMEEWDTTIAESRAAEEKLVLTPEHWAVIKFMRAYYVEHGGVSTARKMTEILDQRYEREGGKRYLYTLFPGGPVAQGSRIAGLPQLHDSSEPSFGSVQ